MLITLFCGFEFVTVQILQLFSRKNIIIKSAVNGDWPKVLEKTSELNLREDFVTAMRNVANSVTVVTTDGRAGRFGATVSSFCSVSADPPTVLVCLNLDGQTAHAVRENKSFCVNVLPEGQAETAMLFAGLKGNADDDRFIDNNWTQAIGTSPCLNGVTAFSCSVVETVKATSHLIFIGTVNAVQQGAKEPLIYLNGQFCKTLPAKNDA